MKSVKSWCLAIYVRFVVYKTHVVMIVSLNKMCEYLIKIIVCLIPIEDKVIIYIF